MKILKIALVLGLIYSIWPTADMDQYARNRVLKLSNKDKGFCSGVSIKSPTGKRFTLTAAHCRVLLVKKKVDAELENGKHVTLKLVALDVPHDLMLLEESSQDSVDIAKEVSRHQKVFTMTHGGGYPSYRTDGELLREEPTPVNMTYIIEEAHEKCSKYKNQKEMPAMFNIYCIATIPLVVSTAATIGGSSGGPVFNPKGELVGIVSAGNGVHSCFVPLHIIQDFLKSR